MKHYWFSDENFSKFLLKRQNHRSYLKKENQFFFRELLELTRFKGFVLICSPHFSGIIRLFTENHRNLIQIFCSISFYENSIKEKTLNELLIFGIGLLVNFLSPNFFN